MYPSLFLQLRTSKIDVQSSSKKSLLVKSHCDSREMFAREKRICVKIFFRCALLCIFIFDEIARIMLWIMIFFFNKMINYVFYNII